MTRGPVGIEVHAASNAKPSNGENLKILFMNISFTGEDVESLFANRPDIP